MATATNRLTVTAVVSGPTGAITAYFNELPGLLVQGNTIDDVRLKLRSLLDSYIKMLDAGKQNFDIQTKSFA